MKLLKTLLIFLLFILGSCSSVRVNSDYEKNTDFTQYKTYAFNKANVDKVEISDLDKKRILRAIDSEMSKKGMTKSETPDLLVNIRTKEREEANVNQFSVGYGWGWNPGFWGGQTYITTNTEGTLYIDLVDVKKKELVWQGEGAGYLTKEREEKDERINEFVNKILAQFPPQSK